MRPSGLTANSREKEAFLCYHLSGGTCELLKVEPGSPTKIGGSEDLSMGQVLDRVGVKMGFPFPAGESLDHMADFARTALLRI